MGDTGAGQDTLNLSLAVLPALDQFKLLVFDGDMGGQWDHGTAARTPDDITFKLYLDPNVTGNTHPDDLIWEWPAKNMDDDKWCCLLPGTDPEHPQKGEVQCENGAPPTDFIVNDFAAWNDSTAVKIFIIWWRQWDTDNCAREQNNFKVAVQGTPFLLAGSTIGFEALDYNPVYPNPGTPVLYDGSFSFLFYVPETADRVTLWDGDTDVIDDGDDWRQPSDRPSFPDFTDNREPGSGDRGEPLRMPQCELYVFHSRFGRRYNTNPSGNREWEKFDIVITGGPDADATVSSLPAGYYQWKFKDLDLFNTVFIHADYEHLSQQRCPGRLCLERCGQGRHPGRY